MSCEVIEDKRISANKPAKKKASGRSRRRPLRKEKLVKAARLELGKMVNLSPKNKQDRINVSNLARRLKVSRTAIYLNNLEQEVDEFAALQRSNDKVRTEAAALRRPLKEIMNGLKKRIKDLEEKLDGWICRWAEIEYNAKMHGYDPDLLFAPMPPPIRKTLAFNRGGKKKKR